MNCSMLNLFFAWEKVSVLYKVITEIFLKLVRKDNSFLSVAET